MMKNTLITLIVLATASICAGNDSWIQLSSMQTARDQFAGCVIGNEILVFGGNDPTGYKLFSGEKYDIATDTWSSIADNPHYENPWNDAWGVEELTGVALNGKFYVFGAYGGYNEYGHHGVFNYNQMYDPVTDTWTTLAPKPTTTAASVAVAYDDKVYLFGGYFWDEGLSANGDWEPSDNIEYKVIEVYDPVTDQWDSLGEMPKLIFGMAIAIHGNFAYFIGGIDLDTFEFNEKVMAYNFETGEWIQNYSMASPEAVRFYPYATQKPVVNGKAYLVGGMVGDLQTFVFEASDKFTVFDIDDKSWQSGPALPQTRESHLTLVSNNVIYVMGGSEEESEPAQATVFAYSLIGSPDLDNSGTVDSADLVLFADQWLKKDCIGPEWCGGADLNRDGTVDMQDFVMIAASWLEILDDMVLIPSGTFRMGDSFNEGWPQELPVHTVTINSFYMSRYHITNGQYRDFLNSARNSGTIYVSDNLVYGTGNNQIYCDTYQSSTWSQINWNGSTFSVRTKGGRSMVNDPMVRVSWYGAVAYANWRSQQEGKQPCYNLSTWACDFSKKGYRLPTESQWEYTARGGLSDKRFPWGNTITHSQANYYSDSSYSYDTSPTRGYHPAWNDGTTPYTSPVGSLAPNGYGLYDMAGNVWDWCNDWYGSYTSSPKTDPTGPTTGSSRVLRGNSWYDTATYCRVAFRGGYIPPGRGGDVGFRLSLDF